MKCDYCQTQLHTCHVDPVTGLFYEGDEDTAGNVHTETRCVRASFLNKMGHITSVYDAVYAEFIKSERTLPKSVYDAMSLALAGINKS